MKRLIFYPFLMLTLGFSTIFGQSYGLEECITLALKNKESVKAADLDIESAAAGKKGARSYVLPSVSFGGSSTNMKDDVASMRNVQSWTSGVTISQTLYDGGNSWNQIKYARKNYKAFEYTKRQILTTVIRDVHIAFYQRLKAEQLLIVAQQSLELAQQQVGLVKRQFELGAVKKTDLLKAQVRMGQERIALLNRSAALTNAIRKLKNAMGLAAMDQDFDIFIDPAKDLKEIPNDEEVLQIMEKSNPVLLNLNNNVDMSKLSLKLTRSSRLPWFGLNFRYNVVDETFGDMLSAYKDDWKLSTTLSLSVPLFSGFNLSTKTQQAKVIIRKAEYARLSQQKEFVVQLLYILETLRNYEEIIPITDEVLLSAEEDLRLARERYSLGSTTILEVLDAQVTVTSARSDVITTRYDAFIQEANLKAILGTLDI